MVDTPLQSKNINFPTDARLLHGAIKGSTARPAAMG
jgi:hypothetical protein